MMTKIWVIPQPASFTHSHFASRYPSVPLSQFPLHSQFTFFIPFPLIFLSPLPPLYILPPFFNRFQAQLSLPSYLRVFSRVPLCLFSVPAVEGCALSGLYDLAASPSTQQAPLLFNVTRPLLLRLSAVRVSPRCGKISGLQLILSLKLKTIEAPQRKHGYYIWTVLPFSFSCKNKL